MLLSKRYAFLPVVLCAGIAGCSGAAPAEDSDAALDRIDAPGAPLLMPRTPDMTRKAPVRVDSLRTAYANRVSVKLREGSGLRPRDGALAATKATGAGVDPAALVRQIEAAIGAREHAFVAMHDRLTEEDLDALKAAGEQATGQELPDLNLWTYLYVDVGSPEELASVIDALNALDGVEVAEPCQLATTASLNLREDGSIEHPAVENFPRAAWPSADDLKPVSQRKQPLPPLDLATLPEEGSAPPVVAKEDEAGAALPAPVPNFTPNQVYRGAAPIGIDTNYLQASYYNANGINWGYTDIEFDWNQNHTDLTKIAAASTLINGSPSNCSAVDCNHGTAVVGELSSDANGVGTTGLVPASGVRLVRVTPATVANIPSAISTAAGQFFKGAVILIEQQFSAGWDCNGDGALRNVGGALVPDYRNDFVPVEYDSASRDAIKVATANGRIVVEAAGNGNCNLDQAGFSSWFSLDASKDSGAILVGAGDRDTRNRASFSNFGARVDTHAEGDFKVTTTGYNDLYSADGINSFYTSTFAGTSSASPMVTGAAVALSSALWFSNGSIYNPREIRDLFRRDGTPQGSGLAGHIGPRPDLRKQSSHLIGRHIQMRSSDFDGDGRADYAVWAPSTGMWSIYSPHTGVTSQYQWGTQGDIPVAADFVDDKRAELVVFRPSSGTWHVRRWDGSSFAVGWGTNGDIPVPMNYDGDLNGKAQFAVVRPPGVGGTSDARWYVLSRDRATYTWYDWGIFGDSPMVGDFDGDGRDDSAQFRGTSSTWYIAYAKGGGRTVLWGDWGDIPLVYRSGGRSHIAVWRPSNSNFYSLNLQNGTSSQVAWGDYGDLPRFGDTDGDGNDERIVYRPNNGAWYNLDRWTGVYWGAAGDIPVAR